MGCDGMDWWVAASSQDIDPDAWGRWLEVGDVEMLSHVRQALRTGDGTLQLGVSDGAVTEPFECLASRTLAALCPKERDDVVNDDVEEVATKRTITRATEEMKVTTDTSSRNKTTTYLSAVGEAPSNEAAAMLSTAEIDTDAVGRRSELRTVFESYDADRSEGLNGNELKELLFDLGVTNESDETGSSARGAGGGKSGSESSGAFGGPNSILPSDMTWHMALADRNADGMTDFSEFVDYNDGIFEYFDRIERAMQTAGTRLQRTESKVL